MCPLGVALGFEHYLGGIYHCVLCVGPSYVPIKVRPPYEDIPPKYQSPDPQLNVGNDHSSPSTIPPVKPVPTSSTVQYPSLPNIGTYEPPALDPAEQQVLSSGEQQYPQATYPHQSHYLQTGEVYPQPTEHSKLLN